MKKTLLTLVLFMGIQGYSQFITVSTNTYTVPQLVNTVLINSPCVSATNVTSMTGTNFGSVNGIGFFQNTNPNFPMQSGVILSTGNVANAIGPNTTELSEGTSTWPGDQNLENTLSQAGIAMNSVNATILEFDFTPISSTFSFDFLFASEEYGNFQCQFSDAFAFLLTNTSTGVTTNLAVIPSTNLPISVVTIRDFLYNSSCPSANVQYFGSYNGGSAAASSAVNYNGQTKLMNASATLVPNVPYHIKLVIADRSDESSDSAIFISSDTFNIGQDVLGSDVTTASATAPCFGDTYVINSNLNPANYAFSWTKNGIAIDSETGPSLNITEPGTYGITYSNIINGCQPIYDTINIAYHDEIVAGNPNNIYRCDTGAAFYTYDLSINTSVVKAGLNPDTIISYHATAAEANLGSNALQTNYTGTPGQTIYVRVKNAANNCYVIKSFQLLTSPAPVANQPPNITKCATSIYGNASFNLASQNEAILNTQSSSLYTVTYYSTLANANSGTNPINQNLYFATNNTTIYVRLQNNYDDTCYSTTDFVLFINPRPAVDSFSNVVLCESFVLPSLTNGNYFSAVGGMGVPMFPGDVISETTTIYIYNQNGVNGCSAGSSFAVTIVDPLTLAPSSGTHCDSFTLPGLVNGKYFTGENGTGTQLSPGDVLTTSQIVYVYFQSLVAPFCVLTDSFNISIVPGTTVSSQQDIFECASYTLPALAFGDYYTLSDAQGDLLPPGTILTTSQTVYVYATSSNNCTSQVSFKVNIGIDTPVNISQCHPYVLPALTVGKYYTGPQGTGTEIPAGTAINVSQTIYIYASTISSSNCTDNLNFSVEIGEPLVDVLSNVEVCESFVLPTLTNGAYYTQPDGQGTLLSAGTIITTNQSIFIFRRATAVCSNQSGFTVTISPKPSIDSRSDIDICNSYVLTTLFTGNYYTGPNGTGTMLPGGTVITTSQLIYIYAVSPNAPFCTSENSFNIAIFSIEADAPDNVTRCDYYTLPALNVGNYYSLPRGPRGGTGTLMQAGDVISATQTLYVYTESGERINCTDENTFTVTINKTPVLPAAQNINACNSYILPNLQIGKYFTGAGGTGIQLYENDIITTNQRVYVYAETATIPNCTDEKSFTINLYKVDVLPSVTTCADYTLPALSVGNYYTGSIGTGTQLYAGQVINTSETIYIYGTSSFSPTCYDESILNITIVPTPVANTIPQSMTTVCDEDGINDGKTTFSLLQLTPTVLGTQTGSEFQVTYYDNLGDAEAGIRPVTSTNQAVVFVRLTNALAAQCFDLKSVSIKVNKLPEPKPTGGIICYDSKAQVLLNPYTIQSGLSAATYTFEWSDASGAIVGTESNYTALLPGEYTIVATNIVLGCISDPITVMVLPSEPAIVSYTISEDFSDAQMIVVRAEGIGGDYEYLLDNGQFQDSPTFNNVSSGNHIITVRDKNGCGITTVQALVINYPKYFTPNGDGYNDTWNIVDLKTKDNAIIYIFDRYGKLLREIRPAGFGWDGISGGEIMPSTDYWFNVSYEEKGIKKEFKSHFAMKR